MNTEIVMKLKFRNLLLLLLLLPVCAEAQITKNLSYNVEATGTISSGTNTPFWLTANRYGLSSLSKNNGYLAVGIFREPSKEKKLTYAFGLELAALGRFTSDFVVQQAYADLRYSFLELSVGCKERGSELKNDFLSSGGMTFSANARPIPQVRIAIPEYIPFPGTHKWLHVKVDIAYGMFTDNNFKKDFTKGKYLYGSNILYHYKSGFLKIENESFPLTVEAGMEMAAMFGGKSHYADGRVIDNSNSIGDFFRIFVPMSGGTTENDKANIVGNQLGSYHLSMAYRFPSWKMRLYYEHYFEDGSGMMMKYGFWRDCLVGMEVTLPENRIVHSVVGEFLYTKHQSGALHTPLSNFPDRYTGADNYYNNGQYGSWSHWGQGIGNSLLIAPLYNKSGNLSFRSNRLKAFHIGLCGKPASTIGYRLLVSFAKHWGTYSSPFPEIMNNMNAMAEVKYSPTKWKGWHFTLAGAFDDSSLIGDSYGGMLSICKTGLLGRKK